MAPVCLDTHLLIWGVKEQSERGQESMIEHAKRFFRHLDKTQTKAIVPTVVVAELLMRVPPEQHALVINLMGKAYAMPPFDLAAAKYFARIWQNKKGTVDELIGDGRATRQELKADCMIIATAVTRGASIIYSHDDKLKKMAEGHITVVPMPDLPNQKEIWDQAPGRDE